MKTIIGWYNRQCEIRAKGHASNTHTHLISVHFFICALRFVLLWNKHDLIYFGCRSLQFIVEYKHLYTNRITLFWSIKSSRKIRHIKRIELNWIELYVSPTAGDDTDVNNAFLSALLRERERERDELPYFHIRSRSCSICLINSHISSDTHIPTRTPSFRLIFLFWFIRIDLLNVFENNSLDLTRRSHSLTHSPFLASKHRFRIGLHIFGFIISSLASIFAHIILDGIYNPEQQCVNGISACEHYINIHISKA